MNDENLLKIPATKGDELEVPGLSPAGASVFRMADAIQNQRLAVSEMLRGLVERAKSTAVANHSPFKLPGRSCAS